MVKKPKKPLPLPPGTYEASVTVLSPPLPFEEANDAL